MHKAILQKLSPLHPMGFTQSSYIVKISPKHLSPCPFALGHSQTLVLFLEPVPQVLEHGPYSFQLHRPPSSSEVKIEGKSFFMYFLWKLLCEVFISKALRSLYLPCPSSLSLLFDSIDNVFVVVILVLLVSSYLLSILWIGQRRRWHEVIWTSSSWIYPW